MTHLIISDDINILKEKIDRAVPTGLIVISGGPGKVLQYLILQYLILQS